MSGIVSSRACMLHANGSARARKLFVTRTITISAAADAAKQLKIIGSDASLLRQLKSLKTSSVPSPFLRNRHAETIFAAFFRSLPEIKFHRELLEMSDGGTVALDWPISGECDIWNTDLPYDKPVLILLPGLKGGSNDTYVRHMLWRARRHGWRSLVFNMRGCADSPVTTPKFYSASFTADVRHVVKHVCACFPGSNVYALGWSLGANILVRYLGEEGDTCLLSGAVSLCNPFNLPVADEDIHKGFNNVYNFALGTGLSRYFKKHLSLFEGIGGEYDLNLTANAKSVREFDSGMTRVSFGFKSVDEYYVRSSSSLSIKHVQLPLLCIQAENDPLAPSRGIPVEEIKENANCLLLVTPYGGHLGWVAGHDAPFGSPWTDPVVMEFLEVLEASHAKKSLKKEKNSSQGACYMKIDSMNTKDKCAIESLH